MFRNYVLTAIRNIARHRLYSFINIAGLAVALACAIFITLYLRDEMSFDAGLPGNQNVYRVEATLAFPGIPAEKAAVMPFPLADAMATGIPEVRAVARDVPEDMTVAAGNRQFPQTVNSVDPNFFSVVQLPLLAGSRAQLLAGPESVVISRRVARKYFGDADPIGKILTLAGKHPLTVTGELQDPPHNSEFQSDIYISNKSKADSFGDQQEWLSTEVYTYAQLVPGATPDSVIAKIQSILRRNIDPSKFLQTKLKGDEIIKSTLTPLAGLHLEGDEVGHRGAGDWTTVYGFAIIAALIILIACFNFTNLATARALARAREMGLRKVVGARRGQLIVQFLGEAVVTALLALVLALAIVELLLPSFDAFLGRPISFHYLDDWQLSAAFLGVAIVTGLLAGIYPAFVLSGFRPALVLKQGVAGGSGSGALRTGLVVLQFAASIGLGVATVVVFAQMQYARHLDLGFKHDNMVVVEGADALTKAAREDFVHQLQANSDIAGVTESSAVPFGGIVQGIPVDAPGSSSQHMMRIMTVAPNFFQIYGMQLLAGRFLSEGRGTDQMTRLGNSDAIEAGKNIVMDASAVHDLGLTPAQAIGRLIHAGSTHDAVTIVGVVADARFFRSRDTADSTLYVNRPNFIYAISVRARGGHVPEAVAAIDSTWRHFAPSIALRRHFLDDSFDKLFAADALSDAIFAIFVVIAIFIACLGLFGLAALSVERRTLEIGVRKVFGARTRDIVGLLLWQFSIPVLLANAIAWPIAWYYLQHWLEGYAYRISLNPLYFIGCGLAALLIAWATVIGHAVRVARSNPVHALRYE